MSPEFTHAALGVLGLCFVFNMLSRGLTETFAVFLVPIGQETGWSRATLSAVQASFYIAFGAAAPLAGAIFDRFGPRAAYGLGLTALGAAYLLAGQIQAPWHAYLTLGLLAGIGCAGTGMAIASGLVSRWYTRHVGLAMAIAYAGLSLGMLLMSRQAQGLIDIVGWRGAYTVFGGVVLALAVLTVLVLPWRRLEAGRDGDAARFGRTKALFVERDVLRLAPFWGLFAVFFFTSVAIWAVMLQLVAYLRSLGVDPLMAATIHGAVGSLSVIGIVGVGWLSDRYSRRLVVTASYGLTVLGTLLLWRMSEGVSPVLIAGFIFCFGITMGARGPVVSTLVAKLFPHSVGAVYGAVTLGMGFGSAAGAAASGWLFDATGGYDAIFILSVVAALLGAAQFWLVRPLAIGAWGKEARG